MLVEPPDVGDAILDGPAALEDQRLIPAARQQIAGEQAGGPGADDHRPMAQRLRARLGPVEVIRDVQLDRRASGSLRRARDHSSARSTAAE